MGNSFTTTPSAPPSGLLPAGTLVFSTTGSVLTSLDKLSNLTGDFTSEAEIKRVYSSIGVELRSDDLSVDNAIIMLNEIIEAATGTISSYTLKYYNNADLVNVEWIRRRATIIGCYYLSMRRANGTQFNAEYQRVMEELQLFLKPNPPMIPADDGFPVPVRASAIPTVSAYIVDDRNRRRKLRVNKDYSTKPYPGQYGYWQTPSSETY